MRQACLDAVHQASDCRWLVASRAVVGDDLEVGLRLHLCEFTPPGLGPSVSRACPWRYTRGRAERLAQRHHLATQ